MSDELSKKLLATDDAMVWAEEFCREFAGCPVFAEGTDLPRAVDPGLMVGWFANAMATTMSAKVRTDHDGKPTVTTSVLGGDERPVSFPPWQIVGSPTAACTECDWQGWLHTTFAGEQGEHHKAKTGHAVVVMTPLYTPL